MDETRGYHTKWGKSGEKKTKTIWYHLYLEPKIWHKWIFMKWKLTHRRREYTFGCQGCWGLKEGWTDSLGLADGNYYT